MKMPFPGMDPYLEHPVIWPGIHHGMIYHLATQLQPLIEPRYVARVEQRIYIEGPERQVIPDVQVHRLDPAAPGRTAVVEPMTDSPVIVEVQTQEIQETYIEVLDLYGKQKLTTLIEIVSASNKPARAGAQVLPRQTEGDIRESMPSRGDRLAALGPFGFPYTAVATAPQRAPIRLPGLREPLDPAQSLRAISNPVATAAPPNPDPPGKIRRRCDSRHSGRPGAGLLGRPVFTSGAL